MLRHSGGRKSARRWSARIPTLLDDRPSAKGRDLKCQSAPLSRWLIRLLEIGCNFSDILGRERSAKDLNHLVDDCGPEREVFARRLSGDVVEGMAQRALGLHHLFV